MHKSFLWCNHLHFNPRTHEECDRNLLCKYLGISDFNPRTHEECDDSNRKRYSARSSISIHALTRSATLPILHRSILASNFNPRTHEECDEYFRCLMLVPF